MAEEVQTTDIQQQPPVEAQPYVDKVYTALKDNLKGFNKTPDEFKAAMQDSAYATKAYAALRDNLVGFKTPETDFYQQVGVKKKSSPTAVPNGSNSLPSGLNNSQVFQPLTNQRPPLTPIIDNATRQQNILANAQAMGVKNNAARAAKPAPAVQPKQEQKRGFLEDIAQGAYLPAFNEGFNDLVVKPAAGATDFIDRTIDKVYTGLTGDKTPDWLRKKGAFDKVANYYDEAYKNRDKPSNIVSETAEGVVGALPLMASMATGAGEANTLTKTPELVSNLTKLLATTKAATAYKDATDQNKGYGESLVDAAKGGVKGATEGLTMEAQMMVGGALGKGVANKLAEKGLLKGGKAAEAVLHALGVGTVFGGTSAGEDLVNGRDIDVHEAMKQFGTGLAFELPGIAKGIAGEVKEGIANKKLNDQALQTATVSNAASNLHGESVLRTLINTPTDQLVAINKNIPEGHEDLYADSIESGARAYEAKNSAEKKQFYTDQLVLKTQGDVKFLADKIAKDPTGFIDEIQNNNELAPEQKTELVDKVNALAEPKQPNEEPQQTTEANQSVPETAQVPEQTEQVANQENDITQPKTPIAHEPATPSPETPSDVQGQSEQQVSAPENSPAPTETPIEEVNSPLNKIENGNNDEMGRLESRQESGQSGNGKNESRSREEEGPNEKNGQEKVVDSGDTKVEPDKLKQKAIEAVLHGVVGHENAKEFETAPRIDLGMSAADNRKAVSDITKGNYETAPAKRLLSKIMDMESKNDYPIIEGTGGAAVRRRGFTADDIQQQIDEAKSFKLKKDITDKQIHDFNTAHQHEGLAYEDFKNYEQFNSEQQQGAGGSPSERRPTPSDEGGVRSAKNDQTASVAKDTGSKEPQEKPKHQSLTDEELNRKLELRNKFSGRFNDITNIPTLLADKEFREYAGLVFKEAAGDFKHFSKELIDSIGEKIREHLPALYKDLGGEDIAMADTKPANTDEPSPEAIYGTKNSVTEALREGMALPPIEIPKDRSEDASLNAWKNGTRTPQEIIDQLLDPKTDIYDKAITPNDEPIMREYIKGLDERGKELNKIKLHLQKSGDPVDVASVDQQLLNHYDEMERALNASKVGGNIWHKYGAERQLAIDEKGLVLNSIQRIQTLYGDDIPESVKKELAELQLKYDNLLAQNAKIEEALKAKGAEQVFEKAKPKRGLFGTSRVKRTSVELAQERDAIIEQMKADLKKSFGKTYATIPGAPQLNAIAPHVMALMRNYAEEGINKVDDAVVKIHDIIKDVVPGISKEDVKGIIAGQYSANKPLTELQKQMNDLRTQARNQIKIDELERGIMSKTKAKGESSEEVKALQKKVAELKKKALSEYSEFSVEDLKKQIKTLQGKIDKGEFFKPPVVKRLWEKDPEWVKNNKIKGELNFRLRKLEREAMDSKKNKYMRGFDWFNRWGRRVIFFGANAVYTKLASAAVLGSFIHRLPEQALGKLNSAMFPHIARNAPIEGATNASAEAKFYKEFLNPVKFGKNTWDIFKTGETDLSRELGQQMPHFHIPVVDLFAADAHIMIKDPVKRATFEASLANHLNWYEKNGVDPTHPLMLESARQAAYKRAEYEIFQDSQRNSNKIKQFFNELEKSAIIDRTKPDIWNKLVKANAKYTASALYHFFIPVNTVPVNILKRVGLGLKLPATYLKAISANKAVREGILNMTAEESDTIMRQLKKGQVSAAYWTLGFVLAGSAAGGLYTSFYSNKDREKEDNGGGLDPYADYLNFKGIDVPKDVQHNTQFQSLQMGATWGMVYHHYIDDKGESQLSAIAKASAATTGVALKQHPVINVAANTYDALQTPHGNTKFVRDLKRRVGINKAQDLGKLMGYDLGSDDEN